MTANDYLKFIVEQIHSTVAATVDKGGLPVTCVIDMMYADEDGLYFLTAKGKDFYRRLKDNGYIALSGIKGESTMNCAALSIRGKVREIGANMLPVLLEKIRICLKYIRPMKAERLLRYFGYMRASASGLTCQRSLSSVTAFLSAAQRMRQTDILLRIAASAAAPA